MRCLGSSPDDHRCRKGVAWSLGCPPGRAVDFEGGSMWFACRDHLTDLLDVAFESLGARFVEVRQLAVTVGVEK